DLPITLIPDSTPVSTIGGLQGSAGVIGLSDATAERTLILWPRPLGEIGQTRLAPLPDGVKVWHETGLAAAATPDTELVQDGFEMDLVPQTWDRVAAVMHEWYERIGIRTPTDPPNWTRRATIYEAQIGT